MSACHPPKTSGVAELVSVSRCHLCSESRLLQKAPPDPFRGRLAGWALPRDSPEVRSAGRGAHVTSPTPTPRSCSAPGPTNPGVQRRPGVHELLEAKTPRPQPPLPESLRRAHGRGLGWPPSGSTSRKCPQGWGWRAQGPGALILQPCRSHQWLGCGNGLHRAVAVRPAQRGSGAVAGARLL